jgi:hypothetical protein
VADRFCVTYGERLKCTLAPFADQHLYTNICGEYRGNCGYLNKGDLEVLVFSDRRFACDSIYHLT